MTIGANGRMLGFGEFRRQEAGRLSQSTFSWRGTTYTVSNLWYNRTPRGAEPWSVVIDISPPLSLEAEEYGCLALRLGDLWFNLADGRGNGRQFFWYGIDLSWRNGDSIEVGLRQFPDSFESRSITGWRNNLLRPELGMAETQLLRRAPVGFGFAMSGAMQNELPEARTISNALHRQGEQEPNAAQATDMLWQWGQFLDHDISLTPSTVTSSRSSIPIPRGDPEFDPFNTGLRFIAFNRSQFDPQTGLSPDNPRQQMNLITAFIDASNVYGSSNERLNELRANDGSGRLKTTGNGMFLPRNPAGLEIDDGGRPRQGLFLAGDIRVNEQVALTAMLTLFVREHNRLADEIAVDLPDLTGHEIFELARKIVGAQMQVITYQEFLPLLLGPGAIGPYDGYDPGIDPGISNEFSTAAFRVGHTMLPPSLMLIDQDGNVDEAPLDELFFNPPTLREEGIDGFLRGVSTQQAQEIDLALVDEIRNMLFGPPGSPGRDLAALNVQRGRDHGLPRYNMVRAAFGLPTARTFADISSDPEIQEALQAVYDDVDDLDLWTAGLAEDHVAGAMVGETFRAIIADQFRRLRDGDRFWFENDPYFRENPELLARVRRTTLAEIIRRNTLIGDEIDDNVFGGRPPRVGVSGPDENPMEGDSAAFRLTRSGPTSKPLTVQIRISETGAMLSNDQADLTQATFEVGSETSSLIVYTADDTNPEHDSVIHAAIEGSEDYAVNPASAVAETSVLDDDSLELHVEAGVNEVRWTGLDGADIVSALVGNGDADVSDRIVAIIEWNETTESWFTFFPALESTPGLSSANTLRLLRSGHTYQIRATQSLIWRIPKPLPLVAAIAGQ
ncbi:MAG: peroxidase [Chloroflexi bacterium]|nr:peroxidase [Chloroflexota bacterium]